MTALPSTSSKPSKPPVEVSKAVSSAFLTACASGDAEKTHGALLQLQRQYPETVDARVHEILPAIQELLGRGLVTAATQNHTLLLEYLVSGSYANVFRDGVCLTDAAFPAFATLQDHELRCCALSVRFVAFAALTCIDKLAFRGFTFFIETESLWGFEVTWCLCLAMRKALATFASNVETPATSYHPFILLLTQHYRFVIQEIHTFHERFRPSKDATDDELDQLDRLRALQASLLYEITLNQ
ncbi:hypothetical protein Poli38472_003157 [Pythium oligandrum]|uniref:Uncharacterized protein n=1 Tax=Pythium oligandrum TaxID=41045 RepID=A0A8K1C645_PYTOL|nr:hypothetical protein Poli38472_003157 [Pythium oligandrum]|eukprot:TMW57232.1 hypothetical protein Poli38472_003157 [Pythium oligandrum]